MKDNEFLFNIRNSKMKLDRVYFWTDTIKDWIPLLNRDCYKRVILDSLQFLAAKDIITVYSFVIMPNHIHLIWRNNKMNGLEMPYASFNKFTAHIILKDLKQCNNILLQKFRVNTNEREYRIWQRDPLAIEMDCKEKLEQKIDYIHNNPLNERWQLSKQPEDYFWSSANFYEHNIDDFGFLTHYMEEY